MPVPSTYGYVIYPNPCSNKECYKGAALYTTTIPESCVIDLKKRKIVNILIFIGCNICFACSKEPSH